MTQPVRTPGPDGKPEAFTPLSMDYRFPGVPQLDRLSFTLRLTRKGKLELDLGGRGSRLFGPFIRNYVNWLNRYGSIARFRGGNVYTLFLPPMPGLTHQRHMENFLKTWFLHRPTPQTFSVALTYDCQCRCRHCSAPTRPRGRETLSDDEYKRVIREALDLGVTNITFTGGEPLLRKDLEEFVAMVPADGVVTQLFSNGLALTPARARALKEAGLYTLFISLDSPDPEVHDRGRGYPGCFAAVAEAVRVARQAGLLVGLSTYAGNETLARGDLPRIADLAAAWGVHELFLLDLIPSGRFIEQDDLIITPENRRALLREVARINRSRKTGIRIFSQSWFNSDLPFAKSVGCLAGNYQFHVTAYGEFTPCDFTPLLFGNVRDASLRSLWDKLTAHPGYRCHSQACRMQSPDFRKAYIHPIPQGARLPYPVDLLEATEFPGNQT